MGGLETDLGGIASACNSAGGLHASARVGVLDVGLRLSNHDTAG